MKKFFRGLPIIGGLVDARWRDHREALSEVGINIGLSTAPIWLGCLFLYVAKKFQMPLWDVLIRNVENGELFIYSTGIVAPLFYFIFKEDEGTRRFPNARSFMFAAAIVLLIGGCGFAVTRLLTVLGVAIPWEETTFFFCSMLLYLASAFIVYLAHVYRNWRESGGAAAFSTDTQNFVAAFTEGQKT